MAFDPLEEVIQKNGWKNKETIPIPLSTCKKNISINNGREYRKALQSILTAENIGNHLKTFIDLMERSPNILEEKAMKINKKNLSTLKKP